MRHIETCAYHPDRAASKHCDECGLAMCKYCGQSYMGKDYCRDHERKSSRGVYRFDNRITT